MAFAVLALVVCTVKLSAILNVSDILSDQNKALMVDVRILVMNCDENSIAEIQTAFEKRKISAQFNKCGSE